VSGKSRAGDGLIAGAARKGDWIAQCFAVRRSGVLRTDEAASMRARLSGAGVNFIRLDADDAQPTDVLGVDELAKLASNETLNDELTKKSLNESPCIYRVNALLNEDECAYLMCASAPLLTPSLVVDPTKGKADHAQYRTSDGALISLLDLDLVLIAVYARLARAVGVDWANCELIGVLRYRPGQEYKPHHDYLPEDENDYSEVKRSGQRARTLLVALNDGYEGGATIFPRLGVEFRGATGDALVFPNTSETGAPYPQTLHAGAPVTRGEKWLLSLWCRERRFWFWN
jgi:prolyl 4-hydroxylase